MAETIRMGGLELEFLHSKDDTDQSLDMFRMTVQPNACVPVPHYHETWDETVYGLSGALSFRIDDKDATLLPGASLFIKRGIVHGFGNQPKRPPPACLCSLRGAMDNLFPGNSRANCRWRA